MPVYVNHQRLEVDAPRILELHADFGCANCGQCCRDWEVPVMETDRRRLAEAMKLGGCPAEEIKASFAKGFSQQAADIMTLTHDSTGRCRFNEGGGGEGASVCRIQRDWGPGTLPAVCQAFPRLAIGTPAGVFLSLSNTCPAAVQLLLREGALRETTPRTVFGQQPELLGAYYAPSVRPPKFGPGLQPSWEAFTYFWRWTPEWMTAPGLTPATALFGLYRVVAAIEALGTRAGDLAFLIDVLDQALATLPAEVAQQASDVRPCTELGTIYFDTLVKLSRQVAQPPKEISQLWQALGWAGDELPRGQLVAAYDEWLRPRLAEFETIERNYLASRLYANRLVYCAQKLRTGYFLNVLLLAGLRFMTLTASLRDGVAPEARHWLEGAALTDRLMQHQTHVEKEFLGLIERQSQNELVQIALAALF